MMITSRVNVLATAAVLLLGGVDSRGQQDAPAPAATPAPATVPATRAPAAIDPAAIAWTGTGAWRLIVSVAPVDIGDRPRDQAVASLPFDAAALLVAQGIEGSLDLASLQVYRIDPATGAAERYAHALSAERPFDRPIRFDDDEASRTHRARVGRASESAEGRPPIVPRPAKARLFNRDLQTSAGRLVWTHDQQGQETAWYAIYFDLHRPARTYGRSPAPWIGDVDPLRQATGAPLGGFSHFTVGAGDVDGDGLIDLLAGMEKGDLVWFRNQGTAAQPLFTGSRFLTDEEGPIDTGWYGAPFLFDWDGDGRSDLLVGTSGNVILWWKNVGERTAPRLSYRGFVQADGRRLDVPETPVAEDPTGIFERDYFNQPWVGDFDRDGLPDIVTGGYTTGRVFLYRGVGRDAQGVPQLQYAGPIEADGRPIDTTWAAAPLFIDADHDGDLDLVCGGWWWSGISRPPAAGDDDLLAYYENVGAARAPAFTRRPFPAEGTLPVSAIARPASLDWNQDGLPDLLVSDHSASTYLFLNVGTRTAPRWRIEPRGLTLPWAFTRDRDFTRGWGDVDGDGRPETLAQNVIQQRAGSIHAPELTTVGVATAAGAPIAHPGPGYGDPYAFTILADWDKDGHADILWGTQQGEVYLHRHRADGGPLAFHAGAPLTLTNGERLRVGPPVVDDASKATDFTILQGSRIVLLVTDFDGDGMDDLVVSETFGNVWVFLNTKAGGVDTLARGVRVARSAERIEAMSRIDVNDDGRPDLLTGGSAGQPGRVYLNESQPGRPAVSAPSHPLALPYVFWGPAFSTMDWNGDGDDDLLIQSEFFSFWGEGSFLARGYRPAALLRDSRGAAAQHRPTRPDAPRGIEKRRTP